jgi:hypothetical protein
MRWYDWLLAAFCVGVVGGLFGGIGAGLLIAHWIGTYYWARSRK